MSIHFMSGRLDVPVEATPNDRGNWDVVITPGRPASEIPGDTFDTHFPALPDKTEFRRWVGAQYDSTLDLQAELETHELTILRNNGDLQELPTDAWVLLINSAMRPDQLPEMQSRIGEAAYEPVEFWPLVALVPKN